MASLELSQELTLESLHADFEDMLEQEDQVSAALIIRHAQELGYDTSALKENLAQQSWYCEDCGGTRYQQRGEFDNLKSVPCIECKE